MRKNKLSREDEKLIKTNLTILEMSHNIKIRRRYDKFGIIQGSHFYKRVFNLLTGEELGYSLKKIGNNLFSIIRKNKNNLEETILYDIDLNPLVKFSNKEFPIHGIYSLSDNRILIINCIEYGKQMNIFIFNPFINKTEAVYYRIDNISIYTDVIVIDYIDKLDYQHKSVEYTREIKEIE